jgi:hypothetical protein
MTMAAQQPEDPGVGRQFLCREPWESYYILRRGILPCCYGHEAIAPMSEWRTAWNSPALQEIRSYLAQGQLSPYCLCSLSCPIVQRHMHRQAEPSSAPGEGTVLPARGRRPPALRAFNRLFGGLPAKIYRTFRP